MKVMLKYKDINRERDILDFLYSVIGIYGDSVWRWIVYGCLGVICLAGDAGSA